MKNKKQKHLFSKLRMFLLASLMVVSLMAPLLTGCGSGSDTTEQSGQTQTETVQESAKSGSAGESTDVSETPSEEAAFAESRTFTGQLADASTGMILVKQDSSEMRFLTAESTVYDYGENNVLSLGDTVDITYHDEKEQAVADKISIKEHKENPHIYRGMVTNIADDSIVLTGSGMTIRFLKNSDTTIEGNLSIGDDVAIAYNGNLNEDPRALTITVLLDNQDAVVYLASGIISETNTDSILLSIDSAYAYRFEINAGTRIGSDDGIIRVGDAVLVRYQGDINAIPEAISVQVTTPAAKATPVYHVMNGKVDSVHNDAFTLKTRAGYYTFLLNDTVKYTGNKLAAGQDATVTYLGELNETPVAVAVYCSSSIKPAPVATKTPTPKPAKKPAKKTPKATKKATPAPSAAPDADPTAAPTVAPTLTPSVLPTDVVTPEPTTEPTGEPVPEPTFEPTTEPLPEPEPETTVTPEPGPTDDPIPEPGPTDDPIPEPGPTDDPVPEPGPTDDPVPEPDPTEEPVPEPESEVPIPTTVIHAIGEIKSFNDPTCTIETDTGTTLSIDFTSQTQIASGYLPDAGHIVEFEYDPDHMLMVSISLIQKQQPDNLGWITKWSSDACGILFMNKTEVDLTVPEGFSASDEYSPQEMDFVIVHYDSGTSELQDLGFISHPDGVSMDEIRSRL